MSTWVGAGQLLSSVRVRTSTGRRIATIDLGALAQRLGAPVRMVPCQVLLERLMNDFPREVIRRRARATRVITLPDGVAVGFDDGSVVEGDLLIGADGLHSVIRDGVGAPAAEATGWCSWQGPVSVPEIVDRESAYIVVGERGNCGGWALTSFVRLTSHPGIAAQVGRDLAVSGPVGS
ncbi:Rossmann-fold NAD(P)-binding domain-containing protein [Mycobacterium tilburgii]|uniref:hypothetical protein n=1 Tax=Mycobacterium tilburgii TaxID=44467 RepID=UPI0011828284